MIDKIENAPVSEATEASPKTLSERQKNNRRDFTLITWFSQQGARFVRVAAWNAKVNSPGKQPIEKAWQVKPLTANEVLPHVKNGGNVGMLCGKPSNGLCLLDVDDHLQEFLEYFPGLMSAPIIMRRNAPNRGKIVLKIIGETPASKKWHNVHLEFLGSGNQGVIPPSIHPDGAAYELRNADKLALEYDGARLMRICEVWEKENIEAPAPDPVPEINSNDGHGKVSRRTRDFLEYGAGEGSRNNRLFISACDLNGCAFSLTEAESMLLPVCIRIGMTEKEAQDTIRSAFSHARVPANSHAFEYGGKHKSAVAPLLALNMEKTPENEDAPAFPSLALCLICRRSHA